MQDPVQVHSGIPEETNIIHLQCVKQWRKEHSSLTFHLATTPTAKASKLKSLALNKLGPQRPHPHKAT